MNLAAFSENIIEKIKRSGIIAVLEINNVEHAVPVAEALLRGRVTAIELTLRTPSAIPSIRQISERVPQITIGIGTILFPEQIDSVIKQGADFGVAPGFNPNIVRKAKASGFAFAPGILTPSELEGSLEQGCNVLKFFPAEPSGGISYLKSLNAPYSFLNLSYIPLGGITEANLYEYAAYPNVIAVGGSWIATRELIEAEAWGEIELRAEGAKRIWEEARGTL